MRNTILYIVGLIICTCTIVMLFIVSFKKNSFAPDDYILIDGKKPTSEMLEIPSITVNPGSTSKYSFYLSFIYDGKHNINFTFIEKETNILSEYINVKIILNGEVFCEEKLKEIYGKKEISFIKEVNKNEPLLVEICYELPISVGNEVQGLKLGLELKLYVEKEGL